MMKKNSKYISIDSICQIIGCLYQNPKLIESDKYKFIKEDFPSSFHGIVFSAIYNVYQLGAKEITLPLIADYLESRPKQKAEFEINKGNEYILKCAEIANPLTFDYYYGKLKKMTLMRGYESLGMDLSDILDPDTFDSQKKQEQEDKFDNMTLEQIANIINDKIDAIKNEYVNVVEGISSKLGDNAESIIDELKEAPAMGYPFYTKYMNTITRGMRLGKFYLRSAPTGVGKSRSMIADACYVGCDQIYDTSANKWVSIGAPQPTLYIATEQDLEEVTTMALAFISAVDEEHILTGTYYVGEEERVRKAAQILRGGLVYFECIPDFTLAAIENLVKKHIREHEVAYAFFDYIHSSSSILAEVGGKSGVKNLREDNVLFLLSSKLKDICTQYGIFILSSTQLNASYQDSEVPDQNLLRGSKAIADRLDAGMIMLDLSAEDKEKIMPFVKKNNLPMPNVKLSIYKNRQGRHRSEYLWILADKGTCRFEGLFMTDFAYNPLDVPDIKIKVAESSIF